MIRSLATALTACTLRHDHEDLQYLMHLMTRQY